MRDGWVRERTVEVMRLLRVVVLSTAVAVAVVPSPASAATIPTPGFGYVATKAWSSNRATLPGFPTVRGWALWRSGTTTIRLFKSEGWVWATPRVPVPVMSCGEGRWYIRWRSKNPDVTVRSGGGAADTGPFKTATGGSGYVSGNSCSGPMLRFGVARNGNQSNLVDVRVEYRVWTP